MKIGILVTGDSADEIAQKFGRYPEQFKALFNPFEKDIEWVAYTVHLNEFPQSATECDAWIISGSKHGVYDNFPWMIKLADFIRDIVAAKKRLVGICFGHQVIAHALGGEVIKVKKGFGIGVHEYKIVIPSAIAHLAKGDMFDLTIKRDFKIQVFHGDQVVKLPDSAEIIATSEWCEFAGLYYPEGVLTFQSHPEFSADFMKHLLAYKSQINDEWVDEKVLAHALENIEQPIDSKSIAHLLINFLTEK